MCFLAGGLMRVGINRGGVERITGMSWAQALINGIIQGLTEFLPVSSSGHLVIYNTLVGGAGSDNLAFTVFLHFATLLAVVLVYYKDVWLLIRELVGAVADIIKGKPNFKTPKRRYLLMVIIATIPAAIAGVGVKALGLDALLENIFVVAIMLIVTAVFMFLIDRLSTGKLTIGNAPYSKGLIVGLLQAVAILPGLSRSGSTIFGGVLGGLRKEYAVRFAFILSIPTILGAVVVELGGAMKAGGMGIPGGDLVIGFFAALICGIVAIRVIRLLMNSNKFYIFGIYCLCASAFAFLVGFGVI